jgi:hypothetical protein
MPVRMDDPSIDIWLTMLSNIFSGFWNARLHCHHGRSIFFARRSEIQRAPFPFCQQWIVIIERSILESISLLSSSTSLHNVSKSLHHDLQPIDFFVSRAQSKSLDEACSSYLQEFETNNPKTNNYGTLIDVFIRLATTLRDECDE